jgi:hypothetical protein
MFPECDIFWKYESSRIGSTASTGYCSMGLLRLRGRERELFAEIGERLYGLMNS